MRKRKIKYFSLRLLIFLSPLLLCIGLYIYLDPFKVIYSYNDYYSNTFADLNRDVVSTEIFIKDYPKYQYKSFILGNSRSMAFLTKDWAHYIGDPNPFHFDASGESLYGIWTKLKYLDKINDSIKNILWVIDEGLIQNTQEQDNFLFIKDYRITGSSPLHFHLVFFTAFFSSGYFIPYIDYKLFKTYHPLLMKSYFFPINTMANSAINNDLFNLHYLNAIKTDTLQYYKDNKSLFYERSSSKQIVPSCFDSVHLAMLFDIQKIFKKHHTNCKIVISPLYSEEYFNPGDLKKLEEIFGAQNVFDFSGKNYITERIGNYYENNHFKPFIGRLILKKIYAGDGN